VTSENTLANRLTKLTPRMGKRLAAGIVPAPGGQAVIAPGTQAAAFGMPRLGQRLAGLRKQREEIATKVERLVSQFAYVGPEGRRIQRRIMVHARRNALYQRDSREGACRGSLL
jgi:hypothetical protein